MNNNHGCKSCAGLGWIDIGDCEDGVINTCPDCEGSGLCLCDDCAEVMINNGYAGDAPGEIEVENGGC